MSTSSTNVIPFPSKQSKAQREELAVKRHLDQYPRGIEQLKKD